MAEVVGRDGDVRWRAYIRLMLAGVATREAARFMQRGGARDKGHGAPMKRRAGWLQRLRPFGIGARSSGRPLARPDFGRGCSSGVEHDLAKVGVEGSNPFARSNEVREQSAQLRALRALCAASIASLGQSLTASNSAKRRKAGSRSCLGEGLLTTVTAQRSPI